VPSGVEFLRALKYWDIPSPWVINMKGGSYGSLEMAAPFLYNQAVHWLCALRISFDSEA
jgi:hypothetical protein